MPYVTDTHSLVWYMTEDPRLSVEAKMAFQKADEGEENIFIPCITFFELLYLTEKGKFAINFDDLVAKVSFSTNYRIEPLCLAVIRQSRTIPREQVKDPWDRLIAATSLHLGFPLITRDSSLRKIGLKTVWQ